MKYLLIFVGLLMSVTFLMAWHALDNLNNSHIITSYMQDHCELLSNHAGNQYWYECGKYDTNPGTNN